MMPFGRFLGALAFAAALQAQSTIPRLANGRPNFQGVWRGGVGSAAFDVQKHEADFQIPAGPSVIVDPTDGKLPYLPAAKVQAAKNWEERYLDPVGFCHPHGVPRVMVPPFPMEIVQDGDYFVTLSETSHEVRIVPMDGRPHRKGYQSWSGDSRGRWEGDTLVVDVTGLNEKLWLDQAGNLLGPGAHIEESFTMTGANQFVYEARVTAPATFSQPWTLRLPMVRAPKGTELIEYDCVEGERDNDRFRQMDKSAKAGVAATKGGTK